MKLTIIVPVFNEQKTVGKVLDTLLKLKIPKWEKEIIVVDDCSTDQTVEILKKYSSKKQIEILKHNHNFGKGRAIKTGIDKAGGDYIIIQDADLEYNPEDIKKLVSQVINNPDAAIYGSRFQDKYKDTVFGHRAGNFFLTALTNLLFGSHLSDMETCYKLIPKKFFNSVKIECERFNFEPEITAKLLNAKIKIIEIPISYTKRGFSEGKKIKWLNDGLSAIWALIKFRYF